MDTKKDIEARIENWREQQALIMAEIKYAETKGLVREADKYLKRFRQIEEHLGQLQRMLDRFNEVKP